VSATPELDVRLTLAVPEDTGAMVDFARQLVAVGQPWCENSLDGPLRPPEEARAAYFMAELLELAGFEVSLTGVRCERPNVVATLRFGPGPTLLVNDHLDNYPCGPPSRWCHCKDPYDAQLEDGRLYARGTSDTRANLATLLLAVGDVVSIPPRRGTLLVVLTVDEERNGVEGARWLVQEQGLKADASITVEPTAWRDGSESGIGVADSHAGHALIDITLSGSSCHIWRPDTGRNPAQALVGALASMASGTLAWPMSIVGLDAGERGMAQFTPLVATARVAVVGLSAGTTVHAVLAAVADAVRPWAEATNLTFDCRLTSDATFVAGTTPVDPAEPLLIALGSAYRRATGEEIRRYRKPAYCDTIRFREVGIPALTFGPGDDGWAVYDESISVANMSLARGVLADTIRTFLGQAPS
jgi:acetylornithine deacetylase/succinyl-diaminopimelate desuccinylase-like protein